MSELEKLIEKTLVEELKKLKGNEKWIIDEGGNYIEVTGTGKSMAIEPKNEFFRLYINGIIVKTVEVNDLTSAENAEYIINIFLRDTVKALGIKIVADYRRNYMNFT